jgi:nucleoside-diphosphate-sugar epimerase
MRWTDNQWPVNFNWPLLSFEPYIRGVRYLVDLSIASAHNAHVMFISSVSAVGTWTGVGQVPEQSFPDLNVASEIGYGQSNSRLRSCLKRQLRSPGSGLPAAESAL